VAPSSPLIEKVKTKQGNRNRKQANMNIFRQLRWKLTFSYTIVTVSAFLVVILILGGIVFTRIFLPNNYIVSYASLVKNIRDNSNPLFSHVLSQSPVDKVLINELLKDQNLTITTFDFLRVGSVQFYASTVASGSALILGPDGILLGKSENAPSNFEVGFPFDPDQVPGLEAPLNAALAGETNPYSLFTVIEPNKRFLLAIPFFTNTDRGENQVVGVGVVIIDVFPTGSDIPSQLLIVAGRSLLIFLLGTGIIGALFGAFFSHGLSTRFKRLFTAIDAWSAGDFSKFIDDTTGDEITRFSQHLNNMAKQLQGLLHRRQAMAVSEERNRLARDLHDSAKQQALAASFQLGTALTLYERDPQAAKKHLVEADALVDSVRNELTNLVHELRPQSMDGQDFSETFTDYAVEWSHRNGIGLNINDDIEENNELSLETREALFRIAQEALANIARHSSASRADVSLEYETGVVNMIIKDNGRGFDAGAQHDGLGLHSMRERAEALNGSFKVESAPGQGTQISVTLPKGN
jgi:signal transduction histidine kinase